MQATDYFERSFALSEQLLEKEDENLFARQSNSQSAFLLAALNEELGELKLAEVYWNIALKQLLYLESRDALDKDKKSRIRTAREALIRIQDALASQVETES